MRRDATLVAPVDLTSPSHAMTSSPPIEEVAESQPPNRKKKADAKPLHPFFLGASRPAKPLVEEKTIAPALKGDGPLKTAKEGRKQQPSMATFFGKSKARSATPPTPLEVPESIDPPRVEKEVVSLLSPMRPKRAETTKRVYPPAPFPGPLFTTLHAHLGVVNVEKRARKHVALTPSSTPIALMTSSSETTPSPPRRVQMTQETLAQVLTAMYGAFIEHPACTRFWRRSTFHARLRNGVEAWHEIAAPKRAEEHLANGNVFKSLQKWLDAWRLHHPSTMLAKQLEKEQKAKGTRKKPSAKRKRPLDDFIATSESEASTDPFALSTSPAKEESDEEPTSLCSAPSGRVEYSRDVHADRLARSLFTNALLTRRHTMVLLHGPSSSGKTMTVHHLAKMLRYTVLEMHAGQRRTGLDLSTVVGQNMNNHIMRIATQRESPFQVLTIKEDEENGPADVLVLLEDVDLLFEEDRGFHQAILKLAETSKRPIILTCSNLHALPSFLTDAVPILHLERPTLTKQVAYLQSIAIAAGFLISPLALRQLYHDTSGNLRQALHLLQWTAKIPHPSTAMVALPATLFGDLLQRHDPTLTTPEKPTGRLKRKRSYRVTSPTPLTTTEVEGTETLPRPRAARRIASDSDTEGTEQVAKEEKEKQEEQKGIVDAPSVTPVSSRPSSALVEWMPLTWLDHLSGMEQTSTALPPRQESMANLSSAADMLSFVDASFGEPVSHVVEEADPVGASHRDYLQGMRSVPDEALSDRHQAYSLLPCEQWPDWWRQETIRLLSSSYAEELVSSERELCATITYLHTLRGHLALEEDVGWPHWLSTRVTQTDYRGYLAFLADVEHFPVPATRVTRTYLPFLLVRWKGRRNSMMTDRLRQPSKHLKSKTVFSSKNVDMRGALFLLLLFVSACLARGNATLVQRAEKAILEREAKFDRSRADPLFRALHPDPKVVDFMQAGHHPLAYRLRNAIYSKSHIATESDPKAVRKRVGRAIGRLPEKQRRAVASLRSLDKEGSKAPVALPVELSDMIYKEAVYNHLCDTFGVGRATDVQWLAQEAVMNDRSDLIDYVVWLGAEPNVLSPLRLSLLYYAITFSNSLTTVDTLLFYDADKAWKDQFQRPLIFHAVRYGSLEVIRRFIDRENVQYRFYGTPLTIFAAGRDDIDVLNLLLEFGADKAWTDGQGHSLLSQAVVMGAKSVAEKLLADGDNVNSGRDRFSLLDVALLNKDTGMAELLYRHGAVPVNTVGNHALTIPIMHDSPDMARWLLQKYPDVQHQAFTDALLLALLQGEEQIASMMLDAGADVNGVSEEGLLLVAVLRRRAFQGANLLLKYGADVHMKVDGQRLIELPELNEQPIVVAWLNEHGVV